MSVAVYANGMSIACKVADGKTIAAFPDVCLSPPAPPIPPIPYPNTAAASDTTDGSKTVQIGGEEVMLKDKSTFKTSTGNEAATKSFGMGVVTHQITGKCNFTAWSMDVKFEGENIPRHMDLMGHNEASKPPNCPVWPYLDDVAFGNAAHDCADLTRELKQKCEPLIVKFKNGNVNKKASMEAMCKDDGKDGCKEARKCVMVPESKTSCCDGKTPHHAVPAAEFLEVRLKSQHRGTPAVANYKPSRAPCLCVDGPNHDSREDQPPFRLQEHGRLGAQYAKLRNDAIGDNETYPYSQASELGAQSVEDTTGCDKDCAKAQINHGHRQMGVKGSDQLRQSPLKANVPETLPDSVVPEES